VLSAIRRNSAPRTAGFEFLSTINANNFAPGLIFFTCAIVSAALIGLPEGTHNIAHIMLRN
jgi:hypothetical protein